MGTQREYTLAVIALYVGLGWALIYTVMIVFDVWRLLRRIRALRFPALLAAWTMAGYFLMAASVLIGFLNFQRRVSWLMLVSLAFFLAGLLLPSVGWTLFQGWVRGRYNGPDLPTVPSMQDRQDVIDHLAETLKEPPAKPPVE